MTITLSAPASAAAPHRSDAAWPSLHPRRPRARRARTGRARGSRRLGTEHDHDALELRHRALRPDRVLEQRAAVELGEQLRAAAEARAGTARPGSDHRAQAGTSWIRPRASRQPAAVAAVTRRDDLGQDRQRGLLAADRAEVEPQRRRQPLELLVGDARGRPAARAAPPARGASPSRRRTAPVSAARSAAPRRRAWGRGSGPRSRSPGRSRRAGRTPPRATRRSPPRRPGSARASRTARADRPRSSATRRPAPACRAEAAMSTAPNRISRGAGATTSMNSDPRRSERSAHSSSSAARAASSSSSGAPSEPERAPSASTSSFAPGLRALEQRHLGRAAARARELLEPPRLVRLHPHVDLAAARQPDVPGLGVRRSRSAAACGAPPASTWSAISTTAPSTQPPDTAPEISPRSLIAIFAPGGRGAERWTSMTVASATRSPRSDQRLMSSSTSFTSPPISSPAARARRSSCPPAARRCAAPPRASRGSAARSRGWRRAG